MRKVKVVRNWHVNTGKEILDFTRGELIQYLIKNKKTIYYSKTRKNFKREIKESDLPDLYDRGRKLFAVIADPKEMK
ncbi:hypothetical protein J7L85_00560 [candidate division WOR-3 bacterium]|nr:hypothetical protein [candidate division WOR-3 bacterium]